MTAVDNSTIIREFVPETWDGDTYVYTELLDRRKTKGNNRFRLVKSFFHRSREEFDSQLNAIRQLCDWYGSRAYTRISPRSFKATAGLHLKMVTEAYIACNYDGMKTLYNKACGNVSPKIKYWMIDVDDMTVDVPCVLSKWQGHGASPSIVKILPSKTGIHYIVKPFDLSKLVLPVGAELKKDANTNLYIPDGAE